MPDCVAERVGFEPSRPFNFDACYAISHAFPFLEMTRVAAATLRVFLSFFSPKPARGTNRGRADCNVGPAF